MNVALCVMLVPRFGGHGAAAATSISLAFETILLFWIVCAFFGTSIAPHNPLAQQLLAANQAPSAAHWFGTDQIGRDMFSRVIAGAQTILLNPVGRDVAEDREQMERLAVEVIPQLR